MLRILSLLWLLLAALVGPMTGKTFFEKNPQRRSQWGRVRRGGGYTAAQFTMHTFEAPLGDRVLTWATWLLRRTDPGSYHWLFDAHRAFIRLAPWGSETWHSVPTNNWAVGASAVMRATDWRRLNAAPRGSTLHTYRQNLIYGFALAAADFSRWLISQGRDPVPKRILTRAQAMRKEAGFIFHRDTDPDRRTDPANPRDDFPWTEFFAEYDRLLAGDTTPSRDWFDMATKEDLKEAIRETVPGAVWGHRTEHANLDAWGLLRNAYNQAGTTSDGDITRIANATFLRIMGDVHHKGRGSDFRGTVVEIDKAAQAILAGVESLAGAVAALDAGEGFDQQAFLDGFEERFKKALAESVTVGGEVWVEPRTTDNESEED